MFIAFLIIFFIFYFFAILQSSFLVHFGLFGAVPNLIFILFFLLLFFEHKSAYYKVIFYAIIAGLFLDLLASTYFGISIALLLIIGLLVKNAQNMLRENRNDEFPIIYFLPLFIISLLVYDLILNPFTSFNLGFASEIVYSAIVAVVGYYIYKKIIGPGADDRQLRLFMK